MRSRVLAALMGLVLSMAVPTAVEALHGQRAGPSQGQDPVPFSHLDHVPNVWVRSKQPETWRDCRGCHQFDAQRPVSAPQEHCNSCHVGTGTLALRTEPDFKNDLGPNRTETGTAFRHHTHGMLECRECHLPTDTEVDNENYQIRTGPGQCARCHEPGRMDAAAVGALRWFEGATDPQLARDLKIPYHAPPQESERAAYALKLVTVFGGSEGGMNTTPLPAGGDFTHGDHLAIACTDCHREVPSSAANQIGAGKVTVASCGECHVRDARGTPAAMAGGGTKVLRPSWSLGAFAHSDHHRWLQGSARKPGICNEKAYEAVQAGCATCHVYAPAAAGLSERDFPFEGDTSRHRYADCLECHDQAGWSTGETGDRPRHASNGADGAGWSDCARCHELGEPDLKTRRPQVEVQRHVERTFRFPANTHPDITAKGIVRSQAEGRPAAQDCKDCHRAKVPELSSRIVRSVFRHDSHLPPQPTAADCATCHPTARTAADSAALADGFRTYSLASCNKCHWGGEVREELGEGEAPVAKAVVQFPHGPHVDKARLSCSECHDRGPDGRDMVTKPSALACNECHDHQRQDRPGDSRAEALFGSEVASCARCHHDVDGTADQPAVASVPAPKGSARSATDPRYLSQQVTFDGFSDPQFHPAEGKCIDCHRSNVVAGTDRLAVLEPTVVNHVLAVRDASVHALSKSEPPECLRCHWTLPTGGVWSSAVNVSNASETEKDFRRAVESPATRKAFGNSSEGYPGTSRARG